LSLDILNFVPVTDLNYYIRWIEHNVQYLCDLIDPHSGNFYTFEQIRNKLNTNQDFFKIIKYFDQFVISQLRSFSHLENFSVGKEMIAFTRPL
jgi:hypothetical protein